MSIKGSLKEASLADVLQLLALGQKTGCLSVTHRNNFGSIFVDNGRVSFASIVNRRDRLGDTLVKGGKLTQAQLDEAIAEQGRHRDIRIGDILVRQGVVSRETLNAHIRVQIEEAVYFLFTWPQGTFTFEADQRPESQDFLVSISVDALLMEGARRVDEWSLIEKKIPTFDIIFDVDLHKLGNSDVALTSEQEVVVRLIDGRRDVQRIAEASGLVEFEVGKALYGLVTAGFVHRVGTSKGNDPKIPEALVEERRNLGIAYYKAGILDEAVHEFRGVLELRPGDDAARFYLGLSFIRLNRWSEAAAELREAGAPRQATGAVFHNLAYALERLGRYDEARTALDEAMKRGLTRDPTVRTSLGIVSLGQGDIAGANRFFTEARPLFAPKGPSAAWFHGASLAAGLQGDAERASTILEEGIGTHPHAAVLFNNHSVVQERLGRFDEAAAIAERGLQADAALPQLHKNVGDALLRAGQTDQAMEAYLRAASIAPELGPDLYCRIGKIHFERGERDHAVRAWERALELDPSSAAARDQLSAARGGNV